MTAIEAESRRVETLTLMFTGMVDSTGIRFRLGEEDAEDLRQRHDPLVRAAVVGHGGRIAKHTGDGVMATFDGAADAIAAALAIQQDIELDNRHATEPIQVRIGISAGDVTVDGDDCFGLPVVEAQRLEAAAEPGQILISAIVSALARGRGGYQLGPIGSLDLKGLGSPLDVLEVLWSPIPRTDVTCRPGWRTMAHSHLQDGPRKQRSSPAHGLRRPRVPPVSCSWRVNRVSGRLAWLLSSHSRPRNTAGWFWPGDAMSWSELPTNPSQRPCASCWAVPVAPAPSDRHPKN